jgi:hypothetical protein
MIPTLVTIDPPTPAPDPAPDPETRVPPTYEDDDDDDDDSTIWSGSWLSCPDPDDFDDTYFLSDDACFISDAANTVFLFLASTIPTPVLNTQTHILPFTLALEEALPEEAPNPASLLYPTAEDDAKFSPNGIINSNENPASDTPLMDPPSDITSDTRPDAKPPHFPLPMLPFVDAVTFPPTLSLPNKPTSVDPIPDHTPTVRPAAKPPHTPTAYSWLSLWGLPHNVSFLRSSFPSTF